MWLHGKRAVPERTEEHFPSLDGRGYTRGGHSGAPGRGSRPNNGAPGRGSRPGRGERDFIARGSNKIEDLETLKIEVVSHTDNFRITTTYEVYELLIN